jgi:hypothetical protein
MNQEEKDDMVQAYITWDHESLARAACHNYVVSRRLKILWLVSLGLALPAWTYLVLNYVS